VAELAAKVFGGRHAGVIAELSGRLKALYGPFQ
jgi:hypothetical protein